MAGGAIVLGELGPDRLVVAGALGEQFQCGMGAGKLTRDPGTSFEIGPAGAVLRVRPMAWHERMKRRELESQAWMPRGDQVVIHVHARGADVAGRTKLGPARQRVRVGHAVALLRVAVEVLPRGQVVDVQPFLRGAVTAFATD